MACRKAADISRRHLNQCWRSETSTGLQHCSFAFDFCRLSQPVSSISGFKNRKVLNYFCFAQIEIHPGSAKCASFLPESCTLFYIFILILARTLDLNFCYYSTVYTSVDVCWNIRHAKLKFYSFPQMRLYFLVSMNAVFFFEGNRK